MEEEGAAVVDEGKDGEDHPVGEPLFVVIDADRVEGLHALETWINHTNDLYQKMAHRELECNEHHADGDTY